jgi:hypothetical protein
MRCFNIVNTLAYDKELNSYTYKGKHLSDPVDWIAQLYNDRVKPNSEGVIYQTGKDTVEFAVDEEGETWFQLKGKNWIQLKEVSQLPSKFHFAYFIEMLLSTIYTYEVDNETA